MFRPKIRFIEGQFQRVNLGDNDLIIVSHPHVLSDKAREYIVEAFKLRFPGHHVLILEEGMKIGALDMTGKEGK